MRAIIAIYMLSASERSALIGFNFEALGARIAWEDQARGAPRTGVGLALRLLGLSFSSYLGQSIQRFRRRLILP